MGKRFDCSNEIIDRQDVENVIKRLEKHKEELISKNAEKFDEDLFFDVCLTQIIVAEYRKEYDSVKDMGLRTNYWWNIHKTIKGIISDDILVFFIDAFKKYFADKNYVSYRFILKEASSSLRLTDHPSMADYFFNLYNEESSLICKIIDVLDTIDKTKGIDGNILDKSVKDFLGDYSLVDHKGSLGGVLVINERGRKALTFKRDDGSSERIYLTDFVEGIKYNNLELD